MWADNETTEDLLGFRIHAELIKEVIINDNILPVTIGVFGDWGSGKSSILSILKESFKDDDPKEGKTVCLYFNSWTFEGYDDAKAALIEAIIEELENHKLFTEQLKEKAADVKDKAKKLLSSVKWMRLLGLGFKNIALPAAAAYFSGGVTLVPYLAQSLSKLTDNPKELIDKLKGEGSEEFLNSLIKEQNDPEIHDKTLMIRDFRKNFASLIKATSIDRLVVIIDDLDRCTHERLIENLEAIKLFLNVEKTAFIIGADPRIVRHAIRHRYRTQQADRTADEEDKNERIVSDYLEKLIQVPYYLPKLSDSEAETYLSLLLCKRHLLPENYASVLKGYEALIKTNRYATYDYAAIRKSTESVDAHAELQQELSSLPALASIISETLYGNPRQIKRFLNSFMLRRRLSKVAGIQGFNPIILAKLMVLEYAEEDLFRLLYNWQIGSEGFPDQIKEIEELSKEKSFQEVKVALSNKYPEWVKKEKVVRWIMKEPFLTKIDLRDYFWLSRDRLSSLIPSNTLIPPLARKIFKEITESQSEVDKSRILDEGMRDIDDMNLDAFYKLVLQKIKAEPGSKDGFYILLLMVEKNIRDGVGTLLAILSSTPTSSIPPQVIQRLRNTKKPEFAAFIAKVDAAIKSKK